MENATIVPGDDVSITPDDNAERRPSVAYAGKHVIWLAAGTVCPHCGRRLRASDVEAGFADVRFVCGGCHADVLIVESAS